MKKLVLLTLVSLLSFGTKAQKIDKTGLVQFSGVVVTSDSLVPVPFANVMIKNSNRGTISDYFGFFSFVAKMHDTIEFAAVGFKKVTFVIPDTLSDMRCSMIQILKADTILLKEVVIFPWPTKEQFKEAFIQLRVPSDDVERAERNLAEDKLVYLAQGMPMDGAMNYKNAMDQHTTGIYYAGQLPPNNLLNPIAWSKFIQQWKDGYFKKKPLPVKD